MESVDKAITLKNELDSFRPLKNDEESRIMQKFRLDWNYHSNSLEGNSLTYGETKALILFGITAQGKPLKDHFEITGHDEAIKWVLEIVSQERPITENFIRELHLLILKEPYEVQAITPDGKPTKKRVKVGAYKTTPNHVLTKTGEIFRFASPEETQALMTDLIEWYQEKLKDKDLNPILLASEFHYKFIRIHPFDDGNGRTARILMNFILLQFGYPPVIIKTNDKLNYFAALRQADAGILEYFINYIANNLNRSLELMIKGAKGESVEEEDDIVKELSLLELRLGTTGKKPELTKNKDILLKLYDHSISEIISKFTSKAKLFERFYIQSTFKFISGFAIHHKGVQGAISTIRHFIKDDLKDIQLVYDYEGFKHEGFETFIYKSKISFKFEIVSYTVSNIQHTVSFKKSYNEFLNDEEINDLINSEIDLHKKVIKMKVDEIERK